MNRTILLNILLGLSFLLIIFTGLWLYKLGRPINFIVNTLHKLSALAMVVLFVVQLPAILRIGAASTASIVSVIVSGLGILLLFISGAFLSSSKVPTKLMKYLHRGLTLVVLLSMTVSIFKPFSQ